MVDIFGSFYLILTNISFWQVALCSNRDEANLIIVWSTGSLPRSYHSLCFIVQYLYGELIIISLGSN